MLTRKQRWRRVRAVPVLLHPRRGANYSWGNSCPCLGSTATPTTTSAIGTSATTTPPTTTTSTAPQLVLLQVSGRVAHPSSTALRSDNETPAARQERHQRQRRLPRSQPQPPTSSPSSSPTTQPKNAASDEPNHSVDDKANSSSSRNSRSPPAKATSPGSDPAATGNVRRNHDPPTLPPPSSSSTPPPASTPTPTPTPTPVHPFHAWRVSALNLLGALPFFVTHGGYDGDGNGGGGGGGCSGDYSGSDSSGGGGGGGAGSSGCRGSMSGGPGARAQAWAAATATATEGCRTSGTTRPRRCSSDEDFRTSPPSSPSSLPPLPPPAPRGRVRFHHQIKVVLVASRGEMSSVKADVWWGERDYYDFRCAYIIAAREKAAIDQEAMKGRKKMEAEMAAQAGASIPTEGEQDRVTTVETPGATSGSVSSSPSPSSPSSSLPSSSSLTPSQTAPGGGVGASRGALLDDSDVCSSGVRALPSPSLLLPPPPPPPTPEQERRHSLANEGNGESKSSSIIRGTSGITGGITSGITSGTTIGSDSDLSGTSDNDNDVSGTGGTIGTTSSGSDSSGSGSVVGVAAGLSGGKIAGGREEEKKGTPTVAAAAATAATTERENLDPGLGQPGAEPKVLPAPAAVAAAVAAAAADGGVGGNMPSGEEMLPSGWDGGYPVKTATVTTVAAATAAATTTTATPPRRQGRVQSCRVSGGSSASDRSEVVGGGAAVSGDGVPGDGASGGDPTKDCATAFTPASSSRANSRSGSGRVMGKSAESASSPVGLSKSPPYLAGAAAAAAAARAMSVPSAVFVDGGDGGGGGGREVEGRCRQAERESSVALKTRRNARNGKVPLPFLGDAPIRRVASF